MKNKETTLGFTGTPLLSTIMDIVEGQSGPNRFPNESKAKHVGVPLQVLYVVKSGSMPRRMSMAVENVFMGFRHVYPLANNVHGRGGVTSHENNDAEL
jgi:hypothetical protein